MTYSTKRKTLIFLGLVMLVTVIIAASLPQLELQPGMPLPRLENDQVVIAPIEEEPLVAISVSEFFKVLFALALAGSMLYVIYKMIRGADWKDLGSYIQPIMVVSLIAGIVIFLIMLLPKTQNDLPMELPLPTDTPLVTSPLGPVPVAAALAGWDWTAGEQHPVGNLDIHAILQAGNDNRPGGARSRKSLAGAQDRAGFEGCDHQVLPADEPGAGKGTGD